MKTKKRSLLLVIILVVSLALAGCGNDNSDVVSDKAEETTTPGAVTTAAVTAEDETTTDEAVTTDDAVATADNENDKSKEKSEKESSSCGTAKKSDKSDKKDKSSDKKSEKNDQKTESDKIDCTISIDCLTLFSKDPDMANKISKKGIIMGKKTVTLNKNATVYDALKASGISFAGKDYISQINGLSEKDSGKLSGWVYYVNGEYATISCTDFKLKNGNDIRWRYTCNNGNDL